jgi:hypothetical protein
MSIFQKHTTSKYGEEDLRHDVASALQRARAAGVHSVICQRVIHSVAEQKASAAPRPRR